MASLSPLFFSQHLTISASKLPKTHTKPTLILCRSSTQEQHYAHHTASVSETHFSDSVPGPDGTGPAAPTRGQRFLEHHRSLEAAKLVAEENSKFKKKKTKKEKPLKVSTAVASCYGCGAPLQTSELDAPGYVDSQTYELKRKHRQLRTVLCGRCRLLSHGHMITAVGGNGGYPGGKQFVTAEQLREKLSHLRHEKVLIVKLVDIVDFNGSFLARVRDLAGSNPIILVVTKVDLLPKGTDLNCVGDWVVEATTKKKLNVLSVHLTSSKSLVGIVGVASEIQKEKKGRDVYILGAANVGKSAFINALLKMMAQKDPAAAAAQKYKPIQSAVPGTTLGPIQINAFLGGGKIYDTPGVHLHHRQAAVVHSDDLPALAPQSRLRGQSVLVTLDNGTASKVKSNGLNGFSIFWGGLVRIDILKVLPETSLTFYGPKALQIQIVPTDKADEFYQKELGVLLVPPTRKEGADDWRGLEIERQLHISFKDVERPACDVAISGLGWICVEPVSKSIKISDPNIEETARELHLTVHVPKPVEIFVRPPLPVAKVGAEWYQYRELTEKEEEARPKCYF
ncbi:NO-associated protein 1, chloroplastic/mitochondrial isoform X1 [Corylus avellana]|uniref:NO-associated protein 1, chloroplastic/mitochondrial isoform X1 n=1 Tax=Corylus avellana TaxID=13451 RepID=UPI001E1F81F1|nr:NO-associated protein 1, chloroplastic/mitochondrial isoform X1 [Corylus avellana]